MLDSAFSKVPPGRLLLLALAAPAAAGAAGR
jgi:hypothetical protein